MLRRPRRSSMAQGSSSSLRTVAYPTCVARAAFGPDVHGHLHGTCCMPTAAATHAPVTHRYPCLLRMHGHRLRVEFEQQLQCSYFHHAQRHAFACDVTPRLPAGTTDP